MLVSSVSVRTSVHGSHAVIVEAPSWECHLRCAIIAVEARRRRALSASI